MKRVTAVLAAVALLFTLQVSTADAAKQENFLHSNASQKANLLVYNGYSCRISSGSDFVPRGTRAELDVGSVWLVRGQSLWMLRPGGKWHRIRPALKHNRCVSMLGISDRSTSWASRNGNKWGSG